MQGSVSVTTFCINQPVYSLPSSVSCPYSDLVLLTGLGFTVFSVPTAFKKGLRPCTPAPAAGPCRWGEYS